MMGCELGRKRNHVMKKNIWEYLSFYDFLQVLIGVLPTKLAQLFSGDDDDTMVVEVLIITIIIRVRIVVVST